jgi:hypothetical protein
MPRSSSDLHAVSVKKETLEHLKIIKLEKKYASLDQVIIESLDLSKMYELRWSTVTDETYTRLLRRKKSPNESIDSVLIRILDGDVK